MTTLATINRKGVNLMSVNNLAAVRMSVINQRIGSSNLAIGKAMMIELLKERW